MTSCVLPAENKCASEVSDSQADENESLFSLCCFISKDLLAEIVMLAVYRLCINPNPIYSTGINFPKVSDTSNILLSSSERRRGHGTVICSSLFLWVQTSDGLGILQQLGPQTHRIYSVQSKLPAAWETKGHLQVLYLRYRRARIAFVGILSNISLRSFIPLNIWCV